MSKEMTLVMTLMVRDEVDIIAAMIEHHLAQGVDLIVATDNGSVDGTREILAEYATTGRVEVHDYLTHDKNQTRIVSDMASRAATEHGATWVLNADADEFFIAKDPTQTLRAALEGIPAGIGSFPVEVTNLSGVPARSGQSLRRLTQRDVRDESTLMETVALHAHPTADVIHIGRADVVVQQGNHGVNIPSMGSPDAAHAIEVLHLPWRSYEQYARKIENTGRSYDANPLLNPSPRHHGMRDYRFWKSGVLEDVYIVRHPEGEQDPGFVAETRLIDELDTLVADGRALRPELLTPLLGADWKAYDDAAVARARDVATIVVALELQHVVASETWRDLYRREAGRARQAIAERDALRARMDRLRALPGARPIAWMLRGVRAALKRGRAILRP